MKITKFKISIRLTLAFALFLSIINPVSAIVSLASPFQDHMVLQRDRVVPVWGKANAGESVTVSMGIQQQSVVVGTDGKWIIRLNALKAGGPFEMTVKGENTLVLKDVYVGEVWLCSGQSNMDMTVAREDRYWCGVINEKEEVAQANYPEIRVFDTAYFPTDEVQEKVDGKWEIVSPETVGHLSAAAYFFARDLYKKYKVPIGLITTAYGASTAEAWISQPALEAHLDLTFLIDNYIKKKAAYNPTLAELQKLQEAIDKWKVDGVKAKSEGKDEVRGPKNKDPRIDQHNPCVLYNGMVAPLIPYAIRGAIWYQGESNGNTAAIYGKIMETLINDWRERWGQGEFPFLYVQLANHQQLITDPVKDDPMVLVRDAQLKNLSIANTGMVVAIDNADPTDPGNIHPKNKQEIGKRLALIARAKVYGENIPYSGPIYDYTIITGNQMKIAFTNTDGGLLAKGDKLTGFAIAGADKKFVYAQAVIEGNQVIVSSSEVENPVAVRYGWAKNPPVNLYNKADLPASPFRTDSW
jgi:sialate O-acetylesterase